MPTPVSTGSLTIADLNDGLYALLSSETGLGPIAILQERQPPRSDRPAHYDDDGLQRELGPDGIFVSRTASSGDYLCKRFRRSVCHWYYGGCG